jgi:hypothetical protein
VRRKADAVTATGRVDAETAVTRPGEQAGAGPREAARACLPACDHCGFTPDTLVLRCPRCLTPFVLGCDGDCRACARKHG